MTPHQFWWAEPRRGAWRGRLGRMAVALVGATLLFALLPMAHHLFRTQPEVDRTDKATARTIIRQVVQAKKQPEQPRRQVRQMRSSSASSGSGGSRRFSMRFTPDLGAGEGTGAAVMAAGEGFGTTVFDEGEVDQPPVPLSRTGVAYPRRAREAGIEGVVSLAILIDRTGQVVEVSVESSPSALFDRPVMQAVSAWRFQPARFQGVAVSVRMRQNITFSLQQ